MRFELEAVGVGDFVDANPRFEGPDLNIAERHGSTPSKRFGPAPTTTLEADGPSSKFHTEKRRAIMAFSVARFGVRSCEMSSDNTQQNPLKTNIFWDFVDCPERSKWCQKRTRIFAAKY